MSYKDEIIKAMEYLSKDDAVIFIGQEINTCYGTMDTIPIEKTIMMPIMEDAQMGISIGLSLMGKTPVSLYTRMDFLILAFNQLINHLDVIKELSFGVYNPKVIIRTVVGDKKPIYPGPQHVQDFTDVLHAANLKDIRIINLKHSDEILPAYINAKNHKMSTILVEYKQLYGER
jgi:pyruvate/2-oxoglutarate/acetoin dehydrogenase E1 component